MNIERVKSIKPNAGFLSPSVDIIRKNGTAYHLKDFSECSGRSVFARYLARREYGILKKLQGLKGVPGGVQLINGTRLIRDFIEGGHLKEENAGDLPDTFYRKLERLVQDMHDKDIAHLDLRHLKNVVVGEQGQPFIVDFETAVDLTSVSLFPSLQNLLKWVDESALLRIKNRYFDHLMTEKDRQAIQNFYRWRRLWVFSPFTLREKDRVKTG